MRPLVGCTLAMSLLSFAGCSSGSAGSHGGRQPAAVVTSDPALDAARASFERARTTVLGDVAAIPAAATALDGIDTQAAKGAFDPARRDQPEAVQKSAAATASLAKLPAALTAYAAAIKALGAEAGDAELSAAQAAALRSLTTAAGSEHAAESTFLSGQAKSFGSYRQLVAAQALWITRAGAGYYPGSNNDLYDAMRAGEAYVVLVNPFRSGLEAERTKLATASAAITTARAVTEAALAAASTAFR